MVISAMHWHTRQQRQQHFADVDSTPVLLEFALRSYKLLMDSLMEFINEFKMNSVNL